MANIPWGLYPGTPRCVVGTEQPFVVVYWPYTKLPRTLLLMYSTLQTPCLLQRPPTPQTVLSSTSLSLISTIWGRNPLWTLVQCVRETNKDILHFETSPDTLNTANQLLMCVFMLSLVRRVDPLCSRVNLMSELPHCPTCLTPSHSPVCTVVHYCVHYQPALTCPPPSTPALVVYTVEEPGRLRSGALTPCGCHTGFHTAWWVAWSSPLSGPLWTLL